MNGGGVSKLSDPEFLKSSQYHSAVNINRRIALHEQFNTNPTRWGDWIYQHLAVDEDQNILAVGCGNAAHWREKVSMFPDSVKITLMDLSIGMLVDARDHLPEGEKRFQLVTGDAQYLPFPSSTFDRVTANHMLYHVPSIEKAIGECARVIKPEGLFMATTIGRGHMADLYSLLSEFDPAFTPPESADRRFGLRNGRAHLSGHFVEVYRQIFNCDLWVTDPQPLVNYAFSMWSVEDTIAMEKAGAMRDFFAGKIKTKGGILIRKESGLFLASKTPGLITSLGVLQAEEDLL
jgi:SAM-dependent methyltransferase